MSLHNGLFRPTLLADTDNRNQQTMRQRALTCRSTDDRFMSKSYGGDYSPLRNMLQRYVLVFLLFFVSRRGGVLVEAELFLRRTFT